MRVPWGFDAPARSGRCGVQRDGDRSAQTRDRRRRRPDGCARDPAPYPDALPAAVFSRDRSLPGNSRSDWFFAFLHASRTSLMPAVADHGGGRPASPGSCACAGSLVHPLDRSCYCATLLVFGPAPETTPAAPQNPLQPGAMLSAGDSARSPHATGEYRKSAATDQRPSPGPAAIPASGTSGQGPTPKTARRRRPQGRPYACREKLRAPLSRLPPLPHSVGAMAPIKKLLSITAPGAGKQSVSTPAFDELAT